MKKIFLILILVFPLFGEDFMSVQTDNFFERNRIDYVNNFVREVQNESNQSVILSKINLFVNEFQYSSDKEVWAKSDYWAKPVEFVLKGKGDCEDYVALKYAMLKFCGLQTKDLFLGLKKFNGVNHAILLVKSSDGSFLALDNNFQKLYAEDITKVKIKSKDEIEKHL